MSRRSPDKTDEGIEGHKARRHLHHRTYGYRGYGSGIGRASADYGGKVHWGSGFGGVGVPGGIAGNTLPHAGLFEGEVLKSGPYSGVAPESATEDEK